MSRPSTDCSATWTCTSQAGGAIVGGTGSSIDGGVVTGGISTGGLFVAPSTSDRLGTAGTTAVDVPAAGGFAGASTTTTGNAGIAGNTTSLAIAIEPIVRVQSYTSQVVDLQIERGGVSGALSVVAEGLPPGVAANKPQIAADSDRSQIEFRASTLESKGGPYPFSVKVTSDSVVARATSALYITQGAGQLDASFGKNAILVRSISTGGGDIPRHAASDSAGRVTIVGSGQNEQSNEVAWITRLAWDGSLDPSFVGGPINAQPPSRAHRVLDANGAIYVWATSNAGAVSFVRKLNQNGGVVDFNDQAGGDAVLPAGAPLAFAPWGDGLLTLSESERAAFVALTANGVQNSTFNPALELRPSTFALDRVGGVLYGANSTTSYVFGRLTPLGAVDHLFGENGTRSVPYPGGATSSRFVTMLPSSSGSTIGLVESRVGSSSNDNNVSLVALNDRADLDTNYGKDGRTRVFDGSATAHGAIIQPDGRVVVLYGEWNSTTQKTTLRLKRFEPSGTVDASLGGESALDLTAAVASELNARGMVYDPFGHRAVVFGDAAEGIVVFRVWL